MALVMPRCAKVKSSRALGTRHGAMKRAWNLSRWDDLNGGVTLEDDRTVDVLDITSGNVLARASGEPSQAGKTQTAEVKRNYMAKQPAPWAPASLPGRSR